MDDSFHERLRSGFLSIAEREPTRCVLIPANEPVDAVHRGVMAVVEERLSLPEPI